MVIVSLRNQRLGKLEFQARIIINHELPGVSIPILSMVGQQTSDVSRLLGG